MSTLYAVSHRTGPLYIHRVPTYIGLFSETDRGLVIRMPWLNQQARGFFPLSGIMASIYLDKLPWQLQSVLIVQ